MADCILVQIGQQLCCHAVEPSRHAAGLFISCFNPDSLPQDYVIKIALLIYFLMLINVNRLSCHSVKILRKTEHIRRFKFRPANDDDIHIKSCIRFQAGIRAEKGLRIQRDTYSAASESPLSASPGIKHFPAFDASVLPPPRRSLKVPLDFSATHNHDYTQKSHIIKLTSTVINRVVK